MSEAVQVPRQRPEVPPASPCCNAPSWWNGWRRVFPVVVLALGAAAQREERWLARSKCSTCRAAWTLFPPGWQPGHQFQPDAVARAVAARAVGKQSFRAAGATIGACASSVRKWTRWCGGVAEPAEALAVAAQLDPEGAHGNGLAARTEHSGPDRRVAQVLDALESLGAALVRAGLALASVTGLGRVLEWQRAVARKTLVVGAAGSSSPPSALGVIAKTAVASNSDGRPRGAG